MIIRINGLIEEENGVKYLIISDTNKNSEALKKYNEVFHGIRDCIKKKTDNSEGEYDKDFMKIKLNIDDEIHLNKQLNIMTITVVIRNIFKKDGKSYPQYFLEECLYEI